MSKNRSFDHYERSGRNALKNHKNSYKIRPNRTCWQLWGLVPNISKTHGLKFVNAGRRGCRCIVPTYRVRGSAIRARENSFALTASILWNSLSRSISDIRGEDLPHFKGKLDRVLSHYADVSRSGTSGHSYSEHNRKLNSLCDHYRVREIREIVN